ncbi:MAG TPA: UDP-2,3-diacylglucosamine diphosphatase, partial [Thioalkalivibrio sp.]|nr:UDP-2,3-diacylglucosamine diphosphatase [Thioalkalivibrio sp.]
MGTLRCRSVFISDVHLGTRECRAEYLLDFLNRVRCEHLYLVGDIFDLWSMRRTVHWTAAQSAVLQRILQMARGGTRVTYIPGNHDECLRDFAGSEFFGVQVRLNAQHVSADGRRFFVSHGDEFDGEVRHNPLLKAVGDGAYQMLLKGNRLYNAGRQRRGHGYWSL